MQKQLGHRLEVRLHCLYPKVLDQVHRTNR